MKTINEVAEKWGVTVDQVRQLKDAMCEVWGMVGCDYMSACGGEVEAYEMFDSEAEMIAEATVDASRLNYYTRGDVSWVYTCPSEAACCRLPSMSGTAHSCKPREVVV